MIDLEKAKKEFIKYTDNFDKDEQNINRKFLHSFRVMNVSNDIAKRLMLTQEEIELATLIGLLHDIGRFEQYKIYKTYRDSESIDHGLLGIQILQQNNFIRKFIEKNNYDNIIMKAILNHNKYEIEKDLDSETLLFCKIIRDADKIDILFEGTEFFWKNEIEQINNSTIQDYVYNEIISEKNIERKQGIEIKLLDDVLLLISFVFDINFKESMRIIKEQNYINKILNRFDFKDEDTIKKIEEIRTIVDNKIKNS